MSLAGPSPTSAAVPLGSVDDMRERIRSRRQLKGRQVDAQALADVRTLLGAPPAQGHRRDLLIEFLHRLNDSYRCLPA